MTIIKQKKQRVAIFIDTQNLYHSARNLYAANVNFKNILEDTLYERELIRAVAYLITTEGGEEKNFFEALKKAGIETKSKDLQIFIGGAKKGDWDVGMTVDAIRLSSSVDAIVIVSGDGDFIPLVEYLKFNSGCQVEVATFKSTASVGLIEVCDDFLDLSENLERYLINRKKNFKYKSGFINKKNFSLKTKTDFIVDEKKQSKNIVEIESPEMVFERMSGKRGIQKNKNNSVKPEISFKKEATKVEMKRVKQINLEKKIIKKVTKKNKI